MILFKTCVIIYTIIGIYLLIVRLRKQERWISIYALTYFPIVLLAGKLHKEFMANGLVLYSASLAFLFFLGSQSILYTLQFYLSRIDYNYHTVSQFTYYSMRLCMLIIIAISVSLTLSGVKSTFYISGLAQYEPTGEKLIAIVDEQKSIENANGEEELRILIDIRNKLQRLPKRNYKIKYTFLSWLSGRNKIELKVNAPFKLKYLYTNPDPDLPYGTQVYHKLLFQGNDGIKRQFEIRIQEKSDSISKSIIIETINNHISEVMKMKEIKTNRSLDIFQFGYSSILSDLSVSSYTLKPKNDFAKNLNIILKFLMFLATGVLFHKLGKKWSGDRRGPHY